MNKKTRSKPSVNTTKSANANQQVQQIQAKLMAQGFSGPLPPPQTMEQYDKILPGAAERIFAMAEREQKHQMEIESRVVTLSAKEHKRGQWFGLIVSIAAFLTSVVSLALGFEKAAIAIGSATVVGLVSVFITGRFKKPDQPPPVTTDH